MYTSQSGIDPVVCNGVMEHCGLAVRSSRQFRKVWRLETGHGPLYLKKTKLNPTQLHFIHAALTHLKQQGFDQAPPLLVNSQGEPFFRTVHGLYVLTPWLNGRELDFRLLMDLKQASIFLAHFHRYSHGFIPPSQATNPGWPDWPNQLALRITQLKDFCRLARAEKETAPFSRLYLRYFEPFYRQAVVSLERLAAAPYPEVAATDRQHSGFCHHDYSGRNILRTYDNRLAMVDFDYCLQDIRIHDLINLLVRNLKHNNWRMDLCRFILSSYHQVTALTAAEVEVMQVLLSWPQDFWQIGLQYYVEKLPWPPERFLKKLEHRIRQRFEREHFLKEFAEQNGVHQWKSDSLPHCL